MIKLKKESKEGKIKNGEDLNAERGSPNQLGECNSL